MPKPGAAGLQASSAPIHPSSKPAILPSSHAQGHGQNGRARDVWARYPINLRTGGSLGRRFEVLRQSEMPSFQRLPQDACSRLWRSCAWSEDTRREPTDGPFRSANVTIGPNNCPMPEWLSRARPWFVPARRRSPANHWADLKCGPMT